MAVSFRNRGYRFRLYLFTGLIILFVLASLASAVGIAWYSKRVTLSIVVNDLKTRETEKSMANLLLSMDRNQKKYALLGKPEYKIGFHHDLLKLRRELDSIKLLELSRSEKVVWARLRNGLEVFLKQNIFPDNRDISSVQSPSDYLSDEVYHLLQLNHDRMSQRIAEMDSLEKKIVRAGIFAAIACCFVVGFLAFFLTRSITKPIALLREGTKEIAAGRFEHRVDLNTQDELGDLARAFDDMARKLKQLDDMKAEFIALVSHQLRTPMTSMKEAVDILLEEKVGPLNPKQKRLLLVNAAGNHRLSEFVEDILSLARIDGGMVVLYKTRFLLQDMMAAELNTFRLLADKKNISLSLTFDPSPFPAILGDAAMLRQVVANLIGNAIRFTPMGGSINIRAEYVNEPAPIAALSTSERWLKLSVQDTGEGIPRNEWDRVFDRFYQVLNRSSDGSGLGLSIAKHIVAEHGGAIWIKESSESGTTFVIGLPQDSSCEKKQQEQESYGSIGAFSC